MKQRVALRATQYWTGLPLLREWYGGIPCSVPTVTCNRGVQRADHEDLGQKEQALTVFQQDRYHFLQVFVQFIQGFFL